MQLLESADPIPFNPYLFVPFILFPLANGYVILRFRLLRTDYWVRQGMVYSALTVFVVVSVWLACHRDSLYLFRSACHMQ